MEPPNPAENKRGTANKTLVITFFFFTHNPHPFFLISE
ncbi:hypothetical protein C2W59_03868 [Bacillus pumilus]|nr:hypothetical protein C2W59_03868 [Bacillus pumilus]